MLKKIRNVLWLLLILAALFCGAWVVVDNNSLVDFNLFGLLVSRQSLGLLVLATFSVGLVVGLLCNILVTSWMVIKLKRLQKRLNKQESKNIPAGKNL